MDELTFVRFNEYNDHEGESWNWWLQLTDNVEEISKLAGGLRRIERDYDVELWHQLHPEDVEPEHNVDLLVRYAEEGYGRAHNKVTGVFIYPEFNSEEDADRKLYKGGINDFFSND